MLTATHRKTLSLPDGRNIVIRPLTEEDFEPLRAFFFSLSDEDRLFLRHDVRDPDLARKWSEDLNTKRMVAIIALEGDQVVGTGRLYFMYHSWMQHVGHIRLITARTHRRLGLGSMLTRELVDVATERGLEKIQAHIVADSAGAVRMLRALGFEQQAVLKDMVKDLTGKRHDLAIWVNDVSELRWILEDWIQDNMIPAFRVPGGGA